LLAANGNWKGPKKLGGLNCFQDQSLGQDVPSLNTADGEIQASEKTCFGLGTEGFFGKDFNYKLLRKSIYWRPTPVRYDGTSVFREVKRSGVFFLPFSVGWKLGIKRPFWERLIILVNKFKIRGLGVS